MNPGVVYAALAYVIWGLFPLYLKTLQAVPAAQILSHRIVWSLVFIFTVVAVRRQWSWMADALRQPKVLLVFVASAALVSVNWMTFIWSINNGHVIDASLGYFINPLVNVCAGYLVLHERLRRGQWAAVALAALGVAWLTWQGGQLPWIGLLLAFSFGGYGLVRKLAPLGALEGLALETMLLFPIAFGALAWWAGQGSNAFLNGTPSTQVLLLLAGPFTAIPLLLFAAGARRIPLSTLGLLQYIGPSLQLVLGVWLYHEPFEPAKALGYAAIWAALAVYSVEGWWHSRGRVADKLGAG